MPDRQTLRFLLSRFSSLSKSLTRANMKEIQTLMNVITPKILDIQLPSAEECSYYRTSAFFCEVFESESLCATVFGLRGIDDVIPLHNHPIMDGYIKVLHGAVQVTSFSVQRPFGKYVGEKVEAVFDGIRVINEQDGAVHLSPTEGNIHEIRALENGTFFFDLLLPGYKGNVCTYFQMPKNLPSIGCSTSLLQIPQPCSFCCSHLYYDTVKEL